MRQQILLVIVAFSLSSVSVAILEDNHSTARAIRYCSSQKICEECQCANQSMDKKDAIIETFLENCIELECQPCDCQGYTSINQMHYRIQQQIQNIQLQGDQSETQLELFSFEEGDYYQYEEYQPIIYNDLPVQRIDQQQYYQDQSLEDYGFTEEEQQYKDQIQSEGYQQYLEYQYFYENLYSESEEWYHVPTFQEYTADLTFMTLQILSSNPNETNNQSNDTQANHTTILNQAYPIELNNQSSSQLTDNQTSNLTIPDQSNNQSITVPQSTNNQTDTQSNNYSTNNQTIQSNESNISKPSDNSTINGTIPYQADNQTTLNQTNNQTANIQPNNPQTILLLNNDDNV